MATKKKRILCPVCGSDIDKKTFLADGTCAGCGEDLSENEEVIAYFSENEDDDTDFDDSIENYKKTKRTRVTTNRSKGLSASMTGKIVKKSTEASKPDSSPSKAEEPRGFYPVEISDEELDREMSKLRNSKDSEDELPEEPVMEDDLEEVPVIGEEEYPFPDEDEESADEGEIIELEDDEEELPEDEEFEEDAPAEEEYEDDDAQEDEETSRILEQMRRDLEEKNRTTTLTPDEEDEEPADFGEEEESYEEYDSPEPDDDDTEFDDNDEETEEEADSLSEDEEESAKKPVIMSVADMIRQRCHTDNSDEDYSTEKREVEKDVFDSNSDGYYDDTEASEPPQADIIPKKTILKVVGTIVGLVLLTIFFIYYA